MLQYKVFTLFPQVITTYVNNSAPLKRGIQNEVLFVEAINFRDYASDKHKKVDDEVYGGGPGMVLKPEPLVRAIRDHKTDNTRLIYLDPRGRTFNNQFACELAEEKSVFLVCGRYEGFDQRIMELVPGELLSMGDFILTGGELAALAVIDASARFIKGTLDSFASNQDESFNTGFLEHDQFNRPPEYEGKKVPPVLLSGHHRNIKEWKFKNSLKNTIKNRPDLLKSLYLMGNTRDMLKQCIKELYSGI